MEQNDKNLQGIYGTLKKEGYNPPEYDVFVKDMQDDKNLQSVRNTLVKHGYTPPEFAEFKADMFGASTPTPALAPETEHEPLPLTEQDKLQERYRINQQIQGFNRRTKEVVDQTRRMVERHTPEGRSQAKAAETRARIMGLPTRLSGIAPAPSSQDAQTSESPQTENAPRPIEFIDAPIPHSVTMKDGEPTAQWLLPDGRLTTDITEADQAAYGAKTSRLHRQFVNRMTDNGLDPSKEEDVIEQNLNDALSINEYKIKALYDKRGRDIDNKSDVHPHDGESRWDAFVRSVGSTAVAANQGMHPTPQGRNAGIPKGQQNDDLDLQNLLAEHEMLEEARARLRASSKLNKAEGWLNGVFDFSNNAKNFFHGVKDKLTDADFYGDGLVMLHQADRLISIESKLKNNEPLTDSEMNLVYASMLKGKVDGIADTPHMYTAGQTVTEMFPFMIQMMLNPASGLSKAMVKKFGKSRVKKIIATAAGDVAESAVLANTLQAPSTIGDIKSRYIGNATKGADGKIVFDGNHNWAESIAKGQGAAAIENFTEKLGEHFGGIFKSIDNGIFKPIGKGITKVGRKAGLGKPIDEIGGFISNVKASDWGKAIANIEKRAQWNGSLGEMLEEEAGIVLNSMFVGDNSLSDLADAKTQIDIVLGVGLFGGFVSGIKTAGYPIAMRKAKKELHDSDMVGRGRFLDGWTEIKMAIDNADESLLPDAVVNLIQEHAQSNEQGKAIASYAKAVMKSRGYNLAKASKQGEGMISPEEEAADDSYASGEELYDRLETENPQEQLEAKSEMDAIGMRLQESWQLCEDAFGEQQEYWMAQVQDDPWELLSNPELTDDQKDAVLYYINSKATMEGVLDSASEAADRKRAKVEHSVELRTHKKLNTIIPATTKVGNHPVFIVSGNVALFDDITEPDKCNVDVRNSETSIIVYDPEKNKSEFSSPDQLQHVDAAINPVDELNAAYANIQAEQEAMLGDIIQDESPISADDVESSAEESVTLSENNTDNGDRPQQDNDGRRQTDRGTVVDDTARSMARARDRSDIRMYEEGLSTEPNGNPWDDERNRRETESQRLVEIARGNGQYRSKEELAQLGKKKQKQTGESVVYDNHERDGRVYKIKDPYAKSPMKGNVHPEDVIYEHLVHNKYFPETAYKFEGISDDLGDVRVILSQDYVEGVEQPTKEQIEAALAEKGLLPEGKYTYGNEEISVTDVTGDNALLGADGKVYFIDPIINFKKPVKKILEDNADAHEAEQPQSALSRMPLTESGKPDYEAVESGLAWDALVESAKGNESRAQRVADAMVKQKRAELDAIKKQSAPNPGKGKSLAPDELLEWEEAHDAMVDAADANLAKWIAIARTMQDRTAAAEKQRNEELQRKAAELWERQKEQRRIEEAERIATQAKAEAAAAEAEARQQLAQQERAAYLETKPGKAETAFDAYLQTLRDETANRHISPEQRKREEREDKAQGPSQYAASYANWDAPESLEEWIARRLSTNDKRVKWSGSGNLAGELYGQENIGERREHAWMTSDKNGMSFAKLVHGIWEELIGDNNVAFNNRIYTDQDVRNAVIDALRSNPTSRGLYEQALTMHRNSSSYNPELRAELEELEMHEDDIRHEWYQENFHMSAEDLEAAEEQLLASLKENNITEDDMRHMSSETIDEYITQNNNGESRNQGSNSILPQQPTDDSSGSKTPVGDRPEASGSESTDHEASPQEVEPTEAQKEAGNYKMEHRRVDGHNISIENPKGSVRRGTGADGKQWETTMQNDYGYIRGTKGVDGDHIDVFLSDSPEDGDVFVIDQVKDDGSFDEHKVMYGFPSEDAARKAYLSNYEDGWQGLGAITHVSKEEFKKWIQSSKRKTKPFADYASVKPTEDSIVGRSLTEQEATDLIAQMEANAEVATEIELTPDNWIALFGEDGTISTPVGNVRMGENQYFKMAQQGRNGKLGMIKPTLQTPDVIIEDFRPASSGESERDSSYVFVKTFTKDNGERYYHFTSVTVQKDGREVVISNQERTKNRISKLLQQGTITWINNDSLHPKAQVGKSVSLNDSNNPTNSDNGDALLGVNSSVAISSDGKDNTLSADKQIDDAVSSLQSKASERFTDYAITPATYTNKKGKTSNVSLLTFKRELWVVEMRAVNDYAREKLSEGRFAKTRGWRDHKSGGWMFRSEEDARKAAELVSDTEAVDDRQPMTTQELREVVEPAKKPVKPKKSPINRVSLEDVMTDLSTKGETKLSDHAEPVKAEQEAQHEISDDEMQWLANELRELLGIGEDEGDADIKFRDPGELTPQERQRIQSAGIRLAMGLVERGTTSFPDYATKMVGLLGDKIRPWLKSFYEGARWTPGYEKYAFTPTEQVAVFDVQNFDKKQADPIAQAAMIVEERKAATASEQAQKELIETRNKNRRENDKQREADTAALAEKAEAVAGEAEVTAQSAGTGEAGRKRILRDLKRVDDTLEEVNDQLALLGYYEAEEVDKDFNEAYGYMRNAEKKAVKDAVDLAKQIVSDLGLELDKVTGATTANRGKKKNAVTANIAPAGGDISIRLPLNEGRELYITIGLDPSVTPGDVTYSGDNLQVTRIMYRVEWPDEKGHVSFDRMGRNCWADANVTYADLLNGIQREAKDYLPTSSAEETWQELVDMAGRGESPYTITPEVETQLVEQQRADVSHNGYKVGDEVMWDRYGNGKWEKVKIEDFDTDGNPIFEAVKGVMSEKGNWERIKPVDGIFGEAQRVARKAAEERKTTKNAVNLLRGEKKPAKKNRKSRKNDVTLKPDEPIGGLFADLNEEPQKQETDERKRNQPSQEVAGGELAHTVGSDATGTDGRVSSAGVEPTDKGRATHEAGTGVERGTDGATHGTDENRGLQPLVGNRGRDESGTDSRGNGSAVERGRTAGAGSVSERGADRGTERLSEGESSAVTGRGSGTPAVKKPKKPEAKYTHNFRYDEENGNEADTYTPSQRLEANVKAIETLADVLFGDKPATDEQKAIMSRFRGWGQVDLGKYYDLDQITRNTFTDTPINRLAQVIKRLDPSGDKNLFGAIKRASLSSYYTPTPIARAMNSFLALAGYKGGSMLDPSMGNGMFEGTLPKSIQERTSITGVELDWLSGQLSRALYPDANVMISAFEKSGIAPGSFDVVTSNVPFGDIVVNDPTWKNDGSPLKRSAQNRIHNYYAVKMLEATRPGGLVAMMTTSAVMDTPSNQNIRAHITDQGEILGAIRLPDNTFQGTGVVTDIIYVRKWRDEHDREQTRADESYMETERAFLSQHEKTAPNKLDGSEQEVSFNGYYKLNPRNLIGEIQAGNQYGKKDAFGLTSKLTVDEIASEVEKAIKRIVGSRRGSLFNPSRTIRETQQAIREAYKGNGDWVSNGNLVIQDGKVGVLTAKSNEYGEVTRTFEGTLKHDRMLPRIEAMIDLRTNMKKLIAGQIEGEKDKTLAALRGELQKAYDNFVGKFGRLQDKDNSFILDDIDGYTLQALEVWKNGKFVGLSDIFIKNSIKPSINLEGKKTPQEAVALSLAEYGYLRPDYLAKALGEDWVEQCGDVVFLKPNSEDDYVTRDEYLSGDVVTKLADARAAAEKDKSFERNVKALEEVQPERIPFDDITIHLGARWIPEEVLNDFVNELLGIHAVYSNRGRKWDPELGRYVNEQKSGVRYIPETDSFEINIEKKELGGEASDWETPKKSAKEILQAALEDKTLVITSKDKDGNAHVDDEQTELANQKIADLRERFETWLPSDPARVDLMEQLYNDRFNRTVIRHFDGSHLIVPGLMGKELRPHQKDAVWMLINNRGGIVDHIVGAGKTLVMQSAIMEMRRMGIAKKPMIVALKSTVAQIAREFKESFPSARVLAPNDSDFKKENRKKFIANISLNDYDCVILSHEQYCMLPHTEKAERAVIDEQMWQLDNMIEYLYGTNDTSQMTKKQIKALEKRRENLKARLEKRLDRAVDREFCFENLGVDYLFVDESHQFKALPYVTSYQKVAGLGDPQGSNRAVALLTGIRHLQKMHQGDKGTVFLSGTTITNSLVETYNLLNYLRPRKLEELGMPTFDAWASTFAVHTSELEATITGGFALKDRFRQFDNVAELSQLYAEIADVRNDQNLKLPKPGIDAHTVIVPASDAMSEINSEIVNMIESKDGKYFGIYPKDPNRAPWGLHASTISAKAAVSPRLIFPDMNDDGGKVHAVCENVKKYYDEMAEQRGVQLIFCEMGVPGKGKEYDAYTDMVNRFVNDYGIPRSEIAYIQEAPTEEKRKDLFQRVRDGKVRILIGGTKNMGTGVNVQDRITDMHMLTVPWTPAALEQCIGRGGRQGNLVARDFMGNKVRVHYYATEGSLDLYKYQLLDAKGKMITQFKMGTVSGTRSFDEGSADEDGNMDPAEMVAILSGNPVIFEKAKQEKLVKKLRALRNGFERDYQRKKAKYDELQRRKENLERLIRLNDRDRADLEREGFKPDDKGVYPSTVTINDSGSYYGGRTFDKPKEAGEYLLAALDKGKTVTLQGFGQRARVAIVNEEKGNSLFSFRELEIGEGNERSIRYSVRLSDDATAAGTAYRNLLKRIMDNGDVYRHALEEVKSQLSGMNIGDGVFPRQAEYDEATAKLKELTAEFNKLGKKQETNGDGNKYRLIEERELLDFLDAQPLKKGYRYSQWANMGVLPPMTARQNGEWRAPMIFSRWEQSEEGMRKENGKADLVQGNGRTTGDVAYNPYFHIRTSPLNDQFTAAYDRPELLVVEGYYPESEETSGYQAEGAKDSVGLMDWHSGSVNGQLSDDTKVQTMLSRYFKPGRIVPWSEVADLIMERVGDQKITFPINAVPPMLRAELAKRGAKFGDISGSVAEADIPMLNELRDRVNAGEWDAGLEKARAYLDAYESSTEAKGARVADLSARANTPVRIVRTQEEADALHTRRERRAKGWWSAKDDEVVIVLPNNVNVADVDNTFVHEVAGHKGLRAFIGEERFDEFLGEVYNHASNPIRKVIDKKTDDMVNAEADRLRVRKAQARERAGEDVNSSYYADMAEARVEAEAKREEFRKEATEEYMSDLGGRIGSEGFEKMSRDELTLWGKIKAKVQSFLDKFLRGLKIAKSIRLNDKDLSYILYKSWKNLRDKQGKGGVFAEAEDVVMRRRTGWDDAMLSESAKVEDANNRFNRELQQQIDGTFSDGHIYQLGNPGTILRSTGVPNLPIQMSATRLRVKATEYGHDFDLAEIRNLVKEMQTPMAVFAYGNKGKMQNIIVGIESNGKQFIVGLSLNPIVNGKALEINSIRNVFPKNNAEWLNWISQGKLLYADKQKIQALIDKQRTILTDVAYLDLEDVAKVIKTFENPTFYGDEDVRFRDGADYVERVPVMARAMYEKQIQSSMYQFTEAMQDSMRGLLEFYKAVESQGAKRDIEDVASFENAYIAENLMSSKSHAEMEEYEHRIMRPLLDIAARMSVDKRGRQELIDYMMAKHGLERNAYMRSEAIGNGEESERDFAGLCGLTGEQDWQDAETAAQQIVNDYEAAHSADIAGLWEAVNKATKTSLKKVYDCGLLSREQYEKIRDMYDHYIPLQGFDEKTSDDVYGYLTSKGGAFSSPVKKAEGRKSKADDPLATIAYMAQNSIIQGNRNVMKQKFLMYVQNHPSDLASVNRLWLAHDETTDTWKPVFADVDENMTGDEINEAVMDFEQRMESLSQSEPDKYKRGRDAVSIPYRLVDGNIKEHQVLVKRNGESYVITINGNPRAAQAVNGLTNPDNDLNGAIGKVFNVAETVNRKLSQFYTTRNPDFSVANFIRDLIYSNTMVHVKENQGYAMRFHKNHAKVNPMRMIRLLHLYEADRLNMHNPTHRMFYEFMHWGGETGYTMQRDLDQEKKLVAKLMKEARRGKLNPKSIFNLICCKLDIVNRGVENSARFAAFITSRESGRDVQRSVYDAKEISVNFNKKGAGSKFMDAKGQTLVGKGAGFTSGLGKSFYVFWNAAVQGTANTAKAFKKHPGRAIMATTALVLLGYVMAALSDDDDDENKNGYYNVPKYTRRSNLMFRSGEQWVTIPLPVEYRALYGLGELAYSVTSGREEYSDAELAKETASQLSQLMPLDFMEGGSGLHAFVPSAFKPLVESATNTSWTGLPIYKNTPFNKDMPEWTKAYPRANAQLIDLSKWANEASGGNDYKAGWANFNPAQLEYLLNGYFGGYSNVINKMVKTGETMFGEREYDPSNILLVNRLVKIGDERTDEKKMNSDFFKYLEEYKRTHALLRKYEEEADRGSNKYSIYLDALKHSRDGARHDVMDEYITDYNWLNRAIKDPECSEEERESYEADMRILKREVVSLMKVAHDSLQVERLREKFAQKYTQQ